MKALTVMRRRELALAVCVGLAAGLAGCGGGGGGRSSTGGTTVTAPPPPPATPPPPVDAAPANAQLHSTGAQEARALGATGSGQFIGIADSGVDETNPAVSDKVSSRGTVLDGKTGGAATGDVLGRGTAMASVAVGHAVGTFEGGVAPNAFVVSEKIFSSGDPADERFAETHATADQLARTPDALKAANAAMLAAGARFLVYGATDGMVRIDGTNTADSYRAAFADGVAQGKLFVIGAGSSGHAEAGGLASLAMAGPDASNAVNANWLIVTALTGAASDTIASYANRCGQLQAICMAAPGHVQTLAAGSTAEAPKYEDHIGTSYAAAQVAAAAALVAQVYPTLDNMSVRSLLMNSADDLGDPGDDSTYGYGRLNVARALRGPTNVQYGLDLFLGHGYLHFKDDITGGGVIAVGGPGTLELSGSVDAKLRVANGAEIILSKGITRSITIDSGTAGSTVRVHGDIGSGHPSVGGAYIDGIFSGGTVDLTSNINGTRVHGDLMMYGGSSNFLSVLLGSPVIVDGKAQLYGTLVLAGTVPGYVGQSHQVILQAASIDGVFGNVIKQGFFLDTYLQTDGKELWIDSSRINVQAAARATPVINNSAAAVNASTRLDAAMNSLDAAADAGTTPPMGTLLAAGSLEQAPGAEAARRSLESLSGQLYAASTAMTLANIDAGNDAFAAHVRNERGGGVWTASLGRTDTLARTGFGGVSYQMGGGMAGQEVLLGAQGFAGMAVARYEGTGQLQNAYDRQRSRTNEGMLYAGSRGEQWYSAGRFAFGSFRGDVRRVLQFGQQAAFTGGDVDGHYTAGFGEAGFRAHFGALDVTPFTTVQYTRIQRDGFEEAGGAGFGLATGGQRVVRWQGGAGMRLGTVMRLTSSTLHLDGSLAWQRAFGVQGNDLSARYAGFSSWAPVEGIGLSRQAATFGFNASLDVGARTQLALGVDQRFASRDRSHSATASLKVAW